MEGAMNKNRFSEKGQALILIVFGVVALVAFTGLAVDGGAALMDRREAQNAADAAALAAARTKIRNEEAGGGLSGSVTEDDLKGAANYAVSFFNLDGATTTLNWPPEDGPYANNNEYIQVIINTHTQAYFSPIIGQDEIDTTVQAVARAKSGVNTALFNGNGLVALAPHGSQTCMFNSNAKLHLVGSGMLCNSDNNEAFWLNSNVHLTSDGGYNIVASNHKENSNVDLIGEVHPNYPAVSYPPDLSMIPDPPSPPTCSNAGSKSGNTYHPGNWNGITTDGSSTFTSGVYCINGYFNIHHGTITGGNVTFVIGNTNLSIDSNTDMVFDALEIYTTNGSVQLNSNVTLTADRFRFYATGYGVFNINSKSSFESDDAFLYFPYGQPQLNSNSKFTITAPSSGPYAGLAYYLPMSNTNQLILNSNAERTITGTLLAPAAEIHLNSNACGLSLDSQVIGYKVSVDSNGDLFLNYDAGKLFGTASAAIIELVE
jgi:hypothetical protein